MIVHHNQHATRRVRPSQRSDARQWREKLLPRTDRPCGDGYPCPVQLRYREIIQAVPSRQHPACPEALAALLVRVRACTLCAAHLPLGPRPVLQAGSCARILIAGQAPGRKVHASGIPFDDASGERLRAWLALPRETFYDPQQVALLPMGFCYPGTGPSGDLPPRPECAPAWRAALLERLPNIRLTIVVGRYALRYHCPTVPTHLADAMRNHIPQDGDLAVVPHPSPRNQLWLRRNPWFETEQMPALRQRVANALA